MRMTGQCATAGQCLVDAVKVPTGISIPTATSAKRSTGRRTAELLFPSERLSSFYSKMLEGPGGEALWPFMCAVDIFAHARPRSRIQRHKDVRPVRRTLLLFDAQRDRPGRISSAQTREH